MPVRGTTTLQRPHAIPLPALLLRAARLRGGQVRPHHSLQQTPILPQEKRPPLPDFSTGNPCTLQARNRPIRLRATRTRLKATRNISRNSRRLTPGVNHSALLPTNRHNRLGCLMVMDASSTACKLILLPLSTRSPNVVSAMTGLYPWYASRDKNGSKKKKNPPRIWHVVRTHASAVCV
ncbi:hypothetical protein EDB83DRAFT_1777143 [Lactarius deliciosus]|nr:hypothetical protein EDB83DRAFT_1777143 [Lactarius deliciosus]